MLRGKIAVVTGAGGGIGKALCQTLLDRGARLIATDISEDNLSVLADQAKKYDLPLTTHVVDVTDPASLERFVEQQYNKKLPIDIWVNNAGITDIKGFTEADPQIFDRVMAVNFDGVVNGCRTILPRMEDRGYGSIVNIASVAGHLAPPFMPAYAASKHAVVGFTRSLRAELFLKKSPLKIILVSPGFVNTAILEKGEKHGFPDWLNWILSSPEHTAKEIAKAIAKGKDEVIPTLNGKFMMRVGNMAPKWTLKSSRLMLTKSFKDFVLNRYDLP